jgi:hypothetical protein
MMLFLGFPLDFFSQGVFSGMDPFLTELFPTCIRGSARASRDESAASAC